MWFRRRGKGVEWVTSIQGDSFSHTCDENEKWVSFSYKCYLPWSIHSLVFMLKYKYFLRSISPSELRMLGRCPLTPEEAALMLSALGFKSRTYIYLAGSHIYGGQSRMLPFTKLYPNLVTKEDLLTPSELAPFRNFSSRVSSTWSISNPCYTLDSNLDTNIIFPCS